jgi:hypothetical protein
VGTSIHFLRNNKEGRDVVEKYSRADDETVSHRQHAGRRGKIRKYHKETVDIPLEPADKIRGSSLPLERKYQHICTKRKSCYTKYEIKNRG